MRKTRLNENGKITYFCDSDSQGVVHSEYWQEYNEDGKLTHYKNKNGFEYWFDYDDEGNLRHSKYNNGDEYWYLYDNFNKLVGFDTNRNNIAEL